MTASTNRRWSRWLGSFVLAGTAVVSVLGAGGCQFGQLIGGMAASAQREGSHSVKAQYTGLHDKSFAVIVAADRAIQSDHPDVVVLLTREVTRRLIGQQASGHGANDNPVGASGYVPADEVLKFQFQHPGWVAMAPEELAKQLEVDRLIYIDLHDYTLTDPGNPYVWNGAASGIINVLEIDSTNPSDYTFSQQIHVSYPDMEGMTESQIPKRTVEMELSLRFIQRTTWLFFDHDEKNKKNTRATRTTAAIVFAAVPLLAASACNILGPMGYLVAGPEKAPAAYTLDKTRPTVVFIDGRGSALPNRSVRQKIAQSAEREILDGGAVEHTHVIGSDALVSVSGGERFSKPLPIADVGKQVGAEVVIYATPDSFTLSPDGQTYSPSATLRVKVVDAKNETRLWPEGQQEWYTLQVEVPVEKGTSARNSTQLVTAQLDLAERTGKALGQLFTKHAAREANPRIGG